MMFDVLSYRATISERMADIEGSVALQASDRQ